VLLTFASVNRNQFIRLACLLKIQCYLQRIGRRMKIKFDHGKLLVGDD
jgi:hypothetical protein